MPKGLSAGPPTPASLGMDPESIELGALEPHDVWPPGSWLPRPSGGEALGPTSKQPLGHGSLCSRGSGVLAVFLRVWEGTV